MSRCRSSRRVRGLSGNCVLFFLLFLSVLCMNACMPPLSGKDVVVVYTAVDQPFAEPVLERFEAVSGIRVQAVYDVEAAKTTGLVNRLIAEKSAPKADVFWNNEIVQTMVLKDHGVLAAYTPAGANEIPTAFRDPEGYWTGMAARARVMIVNTERVAQPETIASLQNLLDEAWPAKEVGIAYPLFGTTATHAAALYEAWGRDQALRYFHQLVDRGVSVVDGNSVVRDLVVSGQLAFGLTDTDDACVARSRGAPVAIHLLDQEDLGTLVIPSTVALIAGAPHPQQGQALIDYLLTADVERALIEGDFAHIPLHAGLQDVQACLSIDRIHAMDVDFAQVYRHLEAVQADLREVFLR